jgi:hypothetical protein
VETVPPEASQATPPAETGGGASGLTAAVLGPALAGAAGAAVTVDVAMLPTATAVTLSAAAILQAFERFLDGRALESEADVLDALADEYPDLDEFDRFEAVSDETAFDRAYRGKVRARLDRDLPVALSISDRASRELEVRKIIERETRYANQREAALQGRALGALEARILESKSPEGARWELGNTRTHTKDCLAMAGKVWPWSVLRSIRPPLHHGCDCRLVQPAAVELESAESLPIADLAFAAMAVAESLEIDLDADALRADLLVMEARYDTRFGSGTTKGGQFKPKRGGAPGRPTGLRMHHRRRRMDLLELPDAPAPRASVPEPARKASKPGREVQVGDVVHAGGEWRHVEAVNPSVPGLVELSGMGLAALDPERQYDVAAVHGHGGPDPGPDPVRHGTPSFDRVAVESLGFRSGDEAALELRARAQVPDRYREMDRRELLEVRDRQRKTLGRSLRIIENPEDIPEGSRAAAVEAAKVEAVKRRRMIEEITTELDLRHRAAVMQRRAQARRMSAETGILAITRDERSGLLSGTKDVYRDAGIAGPDLPKPPHSPELFRKSDLSGQPVRYYVELPDGRIAHPDELHDALRRGRIIVAEDLPRPEGEKRYLSDLLTPEDRQGLEALDVGDRYRLNAPTGDKVKRRVIFDRAFVRDVPAPVDDAEARRLVDALNASDRVSDTPDTPDAIDDRGGLEAPYSYGGRLGLPELPRFGGDDRYELRFRDDAALVMWDRQDDKPHAVWDGEWDLPAIVEAVRESNDGARMRQEKPPPQVLTADQLDAVLRGKQPATAGEIAPGFQFTGEAGRARDEDGVLHLPVGFFKQSRAIREKVVYRHLGRRLYGELGDAEIAEASSMAGGAPDMPAIYAGLNSAALRPRLEAFAPEQSAFVARMAVRHGLPLHEDARAWLSQRGVNLEPDTSLDAGTIVPEPVAVDPPELVDARALAAELNSDPSMRARWHFITPERGYSSNTDILDEAGKATGGYVTRNPETGVELTVPVDGDVTARLNRGGPVSDDLSVVLSTGDEGRAQLFGDGWSSKLVTGRNPGRTWLEYVHPDGRAFDVLMRPNGEMDLESARTFEASQSAVRQAKMAAIARDPVRFIAAGDNLVDVRSAMERDWDGLSVSTNAMGGQTIRFIARTGPARKMLVEAKLGKVQRVGWGDPGARGLEGARFIDKAEHDRLLQELIDRQRREEEAAQTREGRGPAALGAWLQDVAGKKAPRGGHKPPADVVASLVEGRNLNEVRALLIDNGWEHYKGGRRWNSQKRTYVGTYKLRGKAGTANEGASLELKGLMLRGSDEPVEVKVSPNPQGVGAEARKRVTGRAWKDMDELYRDALGRADELGERFGAKVHVTTIRDESAGSAAAHHEWNGTIVMGAGKHTRFKQRFADYLKKREAGTASVSDHQDFYDALSTLQHEINHGVGKAGTEEGGLAFGSRHYRKALNGLSHTGVMEEALTEESARLLTIDWLRAQGMTDVLESVKRMSKTDSRYRGSYTGYRDRLRTLFDLAGVPQESRTDLIMRMKFQMGPQERGRYLDDQIRARVAAMTDAERRELPTPLVRNIGTGDRPSSPGEFIMASSSFGGGGGRGRWGATLSKSGDFEPVVDDPIDDVHVELSVGEQAKRGDRLRWEFAGKRFEGEMLYHGSTNGVPLVTVKTADGQRHDVWAADITEIVGGAKQSPLEPRSTISDGTAVHRGSMVSLTSGGEQITGTVVEVMDESNVKVRTEDGLALWYAPERLRRWEG